mgnify:FL=1
MSLNMKNTMQPKYFLNELGWWSVFILSIGISVYAFIVYGTNFTDTSVHPEMVETYQQHPVGIYTHIFASMVALALGPFQLSTYLRNRYIHLHRWVGKTYLFIGVLPGGISGIYMAQLAYGGIVSSFGFSLSAIAWLFTGFMAFQSIRKKDIDGHRIWMWRNFSLTFAAVTIRIYIGIFFAAGLSFEDFYPLLTWLCWVPNILFVEWVLNKHNKPLQRTVIRR